MITERKLVQAAIGVSCDAGIVRGGNRTPSVNLRSANPPHAGFFARPDVRFLRCAWVRRGMGMA